MEETGDTGEPTWHKWDNHHVRIKEDPSYVPSMFDPEVLEHEVAQFLAAIYPDVDEHFPCRFKECQIIAHTRMWIQRRHRTGGWVQGVYHCPNCGQAYSPAKDGEHLLKARKVIICAGTFGTGMDHATFQAAARDIRTGIYQTDFTYSLFWIEWPDTATTRLLHELKQNTGGISKDIVAQVRGMDQMTARRTIDEIADKFMPMYFQDMLIGDEATKVLIHNNWSTKYTLRASNLLVDDKGRRYYKGLRVPFEPDVPRVLTAEDVIRTLGMAQCLMFSSEQSPMQRAATA